MQQQFLRFGSFCFAKVCLLILGWNCIPLLLPAQVAGSDLPKEFDQYGGYKGIQGTTTGVWHIEKIEDRHWFVTPEGNAMYVLGINHIDASTEEEKQRTIQNLATWGFNSAGYGVPQWMYPSYPGFVSIRLHDAPHWLPADRFGFEDVFEVAFEVKVKEIIRKSCETGRDNTQVIGYSFTDTPRYDLDISRARRGEDWVSFIRSLGAEAAGKQQYVDFLRASYQGDFGAFQQAYRLESPKSFEDLLAYDFRYLELFRPAIRRDDEVFLAHIAERIYQLSRTYMDTYHPGAILLSEKYKMHDHPEEVLKRAGKYFDLISIQPGPTMGPDVGQGPDESEFDATYWQELYQLTGKPILITDHGFAFHTPEYPRTLWHQFSSEQEAGEFYEHYLQQVIEQPFIVGYLKCQYKSRYDPLRTLLKQGMLNIQGEPYDKLANKVSRVNEQILSQVYR